MRICEKRARPGRLPGIATLPALAALAAGLVLAGCGSSRPGGYDAPDYDEFPAGVAQALRACTVRYGYNPDVSAQIPDNQLAPGEEDWRDCAHDAFEDILGPNMKNPDQLDALIDEDEELTEAIAEGRATRSQRRAVLSARLNTIRAAEQAYPTGQPVGSAGPVLSQTDANLAYQRIRGDIEAIARLF
jgi:hypothetical protein